MERPGTAERPGAPTAESGRRALVVAVAAPAVDGKANEAVRRAVAAAFGLRARDVTLVSGERSRDKVLDLDGGDEARLAELLSGQGAAAAPGGSTAKRA